MYTSDIRGFLCKIITLVIGLHRAAFLPLLLAYDSLMLVRFLQPDRGRFLPFDLSYLQLGLEELFLFLVFDGLFGRYLSIVELLNLLIVNCYLLDQLHLLIVQHLLLE